MKTIKNAIMELFVMGKWIYHDIMWDLYTMPYQLYLNCKRYGYDNVFPNLEDIRKNKGYERSL